MNLYLLAFANFAVGMGAFVVIGVLSPVAQGFGIDRAAAAKPFGRILDPKEVARAVLWMASDDSGMMTGAVIPFDQSVYGGYDDAPTPAAKLEV